MSNIAYIDGQNLYMGTAKSNPQWHVDLARLRQYLERKYNVSRAYYYLESLPIQDGTERGFSFQSIMTLK